MLTYFYLNLIFSVGLLVVMEHFYSVALVMFLKSKIGLSEHSAGTNILYRSFTLIY